jgi:hypothetical protein
LKEREKPTNGKPLRIASCPHADVCAAPKMHEEVMISIDKLADSVGMLLEKHDQLLERTTNLHTKLYEVSERQIVASEREEAWLLELGSLTTRVAKESIKAVHDELTPLIKDEVRKHQEQS